MEHVDMQEQIVDIVLAKDKARALKLFVQLPMLKKLTEEEKSELFTKMFEGTKNYLKGWE